MAADKEIIAQIRKIEAEAPAEVLATLTDHLGRAEPVALAESLRQWIFSLKTQIDLWNRSGAKGAKGTAAELLAVVDHVTQLADVVIQLDTPPANPALPVQFCGDSADHGPHTWPHPDGNIGTLTCDGNHPRDLSGLDALINDAKHLAKVGEIFSTPDGALAGDVEAYISGAINDLPAAPPGGVTFRGELSGAELDDFKAQFAATNQPATMVMQAREIGAQMPEAQIKAPPLGQPGDVGAGYSASYVPPGGRQLTYAELLTPVPVATLPPHLSHSQISGIGDCPVAYRAVKIESLTEIPQWANVGGNTLHAAIEALERTVTGLGVPWTPAMTEQYDCETTWKHHFAEQIATVAAASRVPEGMWRSSRSGQEGKPWWEVNGPLMLRRYLVAHPDEPTAVLSTTNSGSERLSAIEIPFEVTVPTAYGPIPFKAIVDRITVQQHGETTLVIRDNKTSYDRPKDTSQLGEYAWVLRLAGVPESVKIMGTFFDARRGEWTTPVDLIEAHPWEWFVYRVTAAEGQKRALSTGPTAAHVSKFCGGCAVRYACPIMAMRT